MLFWFLIAYVDIKSFWSQERDDAELMVELAMPYTFLNKTGQDHNYEPIVTGKQNEEEIYNEKNNLTDSTFKMISDENNNQESGSNLNKTVINETALSNINRTNKEYNSLDRMEDKSIKKVSQEISDELINKNPNKIDDAFLEWSPEVNLSINSSLNSTKDEKDLHNAHENTTIFESYPKNEQIVKDGFEDYKIESEILSPNIKIKNPKAECVPPIYSYTKDQAKSRFPYGRKRLFSCGEDFSTFTLKNNFLYLNCSSGEFSLGNEPANELLGNLPFDQRWFYYSAPLNLGNREFGFTRCGDFKKQAFLHNKFSENASKRSQEKRKSIEKTLNLTSSKPLTVLTVVFDSVSRQHFYRTLTKTVDFMNHNIVKGNFSSKFAIYDFQIEHANGENTLPNIVPLLLGNSLDDQRAKIRGLPISTRAQEEWLKVQEEDALWKNYERQGFVTMFGWETKWDYLSSVVSRKVFADHVVSSLYNAAWTQIGFCDVCDWARCMGNQHSHQFLFNYTKEFINNYKDHNKFSYIHFSHGHEWTGSVISSIDKDFAGFIKDVLEFYTNNREDVVLVLTSDHGLHLGSWDSFEEGRAENLLPYSFVITNKEILEKIGKDTHEILSHNTQHITSKYDMHLTQKYLAKVPYEIIEKDSQKYRELKSNKPHLNQAVSLFVEKINDSRACEDIGTPPYWCTCWKYEEISIDGIEDLVDHIGIQAANEINGRIKRENVQNYCISSVEFDKAILVEHSPIRDITDLNTGMYKIKFPVKDHPDYLFSVQAIAVPERLFHKFEKKSHDNEWFPVSTFWTSGQQLKIQVQFIGRVDAKQDICIQMEASIGGKIAYCICQKPKDYNFSTQLEPNKKKFYENLVDSISVVVGKNGTSCTEACRDERKSCLEWALQIVNQHSLLSQPWSEKNNYNVAIDKRSVWFKSLKIENFEDGEFPGLKHENNTLTFVKGDWNALKCDLRAHNIQPICSCLKHPIEVD